jgi:ABC-type phosphate transport system auxiliary subunit
MKQMIKIIRKVDIEKQYEHVLRLELDYELASLYSAMQENNEKEMEKCKKRLKEIQDELDGLHAYV